jgi:hypothetical protein
MAIGALPVAVPGDKDKPIQAREFRITWIVALIGMVGPAIATFVVSSYPRIPKNSVVIPAAVLGVIAVTIFAVILVFIADIRSRTAITVANLEPEPAVPAEKPSEPVATGEFRLTWVAGVIGVVGPAIAAFVAHMYPDVPSDNLVVPVAVLVVMAVSIMSVALVFFVDVRSRTAVTIALRSRPK